MTTEAYQHILLATDFSPEGEAVVERAAELRDRYQARLSLVHVVEYISLEYAGDLILPEDLDLEDKLVASARRRMAALGERMAVDTARQHVLAGSTKTEILRIAEHEGVDLIVLGSHGRHGLALLLGSTANAVLHHAGCDVLAVRVGA